MTYTFDAAWEQERERLAGIERLWDGGTQDLLRGLGVGSGWSCLEVGAGGGSITAWLCDQVGPQGRVVATDLDTRFVGAIERPNLDVRVHNIVVDAALPEQFDLVHSRLLVEHIGLGALGRMFESVRPGGLLVVEDYDWASSAAWPDDGLFARVGDAIIALMSGAGFDPFLGRKLVRALCDAGLVDVDATGRSVFVRGGTPSTAFYRLSMAALRSPLVASGAVSDDEVDGALAMMDDVGWTALTPVLVAAWGRRPR